MTGALLPEGADSVVPFEDVDDQGDAIELSRPVVAGACVRPAGQDVEAGVTVLAVGTQLSSARIGLLAALGYAEVPVVRQPRVAIIATGDELVPPGSPLRPGQIYNSNAPMLAAAVREAGGEPTYLSSVGDDPDEIAAELHAAREADLLLTSGGASVGDFDHVKAVLGAAGKVNFWRVRIRPGKPLIFGSIANVPLIGLPGNPTSAMVTFEVFVRPAIRTMLGMTRCRPTVEVMVDDEIDNRGGRETYARMRIRYRSGRFHASLSGIQDSAMLAPLARADGLLIIPHDVEKLYPGDMAAALVWRLPES
jgi:molybdopterin molybdotransferase